MARVKPHLRGISTLALAMLGGDAATACGGRTLEPDPHADASGAVNRDNGSGNTGAESSDGGGSRATSTTAHTMGAMLGQGACDAPYDLGTAVGSFNGVTAGSSTFLSACSGGGPETFLLWTAPEAGTYRINTFGSEVDTVLSQLLQPNCDSLGIVQCSDDTKGARDAEIVLHAERGEVCSLVVDSFEPGGRFQLEIVRSGER